MFTQPLMYKVIQGHKNAHQQYVERLLAGGSVTKEQVRGECVGAAVWRPRPGEAGAASAAACFF